MKHLSSFEILALAAIIALAAFFRFYRLDQLPPGFQFDQAFYVFDVIRLLQGEFHIFFAAPGGTEPLYPYLALVGGALFGDTAFGLRLTGALIGTLTIPLVYFFARSFFQSTRAGLLAAFCAAVSLWHIFFNRYGERVTLLVFLTIFVFWFFWRALEQPQRKYFALTGLFTALALYTYPGSRVLPIALVLLTVYVVIDDRRNASRYIKGLLVTLAVTAILCLPLGVYFFLHPDQFLSHSAEVSIFVPHGNVPTDVVAAFVSNAEKILGMFFVAGDSGVLRNPIPGRPIFDPLLGGLFALGVIVWLVTLFSPRSSQIARRRAVVLAVWLAAMLAISLVTDDAPNFGRTLPAFPVVMIFPAWGAIEIWKRLHTPMLRRVAVVGLSIVALFTTGFAFRDYFVVFANDPGTYYTFDTDKLELGNWLKQNAPTHRIFLAPLLSQNGTISLLTRNAPLKSFESRDTIVLPAHTSGEDAIFVFPNEQDKKIKALAERLGDLGAREVLTGSNGGTLAWLYRIPAQNLPAAANPLATLARGGDFIQPHILTRATWGDSFELLGYSIDAADAPKRNLQVTLFFHALKPMTQDYTFSVKARDAKDRTWGQEDKWLGDNSYATTQWSPGDLIIEKFYPGLNACAPADDYHISVEAYNPSTAQTLGAVINLGTWRADASPGNRLEDLEIDHRLDAAIGQAQLLGYALTPAEIHAGDPFSLALFWRGVGDGKQSLAAVVKLRDALKHDFVLADRAASLPSAGRGLCTFFDFNAPQDVAPGAGSIFVNDVEIGTIPIAR